MNQKKLHFLMRFTEAGTVLVVIAATIGGFLFLWQNGGQKLNCSQLPLYSFSAMVLGHKIIFASIIMLIILQIMRLVIIILDFASKRDWIYVVMGTFILLVIGYSLVS